jgi:hypothetical protein
VTRLLWTPPIAPWDAIGVERIEDHRGIDFVIDVSGWRDRRIEALRAHRTQHQSIDRYFFDRPDLEQVLATEYWRQGFGPALVERPSKEIQLW